MFLTLVKFLPRRVILIQIEQEWALVSFNQKYDIVDWEGNSLIKSNFNEIPRHMFSNKDLGHPFN